jgi:hypothetical protein
MALSERERAILDLERTWWVSGGTKELTMRRRASLSPARYHQLLRRLVDSAEAYSYDPLVVARLRRARAARRSHGLAGPPHRSALRAGDEPLP